MLNITYPNLAENVSILKYLSPYAVSLTENPEDETSEHIIKRQEKFLTLSEPIKDKLVSEKTIEEIQLIGKNFNLELPQIANISRAIRSYYFGEIQLEEFPLILSQEMKVSTEMAQKISRLIIERIINDDSQEKSYQAQLEKLPISVALEKYPELGEQLITQNRIKLAVFPDPVRPSINNWLTDYTYVIGIKNRDPLVRANYLFKSENGKNLNSANRDKLAEILKSFEEKTPLTINTKTKQIIFLPPTEKRSEKPLANQPLFPPKPATPVFTNDADRLSAWRKNLPPKEILEKEPEDSLPQKISFSSPQMFPVEKVKNVPSSSNQKYLPSSPPSQAKPNPERLMPKNVVNLKDNDQF